MAKVIAITQQKGGTGKTTTAHAIGTGLAKRGYKVLFIDSDPQGNLTYTMNADPSKPGTLEVLTRQLEAIATIQHQPQGDIIPAAQTLATAELNLTQTGKEHRLQEAVTALRNIYDYIVIDTPPALGTLTVNALTAADEVFIPCLADAFSIQATAQIADTIDTIRRYCNPSLRIAGIIITRYNSRQILTRDIENLLEAAAAKLETKVFKTRIRETVIIREAQATQASIFDYAPKSNAAKDYQSIIEEYTK